MAEEQKKDAERTEEASGRKRGLLDDKVVLLGAIVIVQALLALGITRFVIVPRLAVQEASAEAGGGTTDGAAAGGQTGEAASVIVGLEEMILSLQGDGGKASFLKIDVNLDVADEKTAERVRQRLPELRDIVIMTLSSRRAPDLLSPEGKQAVRGEIFRQLAERLPAGTLRSVYFSDLVIQ